MWLLSLSVLLQTITKKCFQNSRSDSRPRLPAGLRIRYFDFKVLGPASIGGISHLFLSQLWNSTSMPRVESGGPPHILAVEYANPQDNPP
jgi:hypothetical protein